MKQFQTKPIQGRSQDFILTETKGYTGGLGRSPSRVQGQSPWSGGQGGEALLKPGGEAPLKLKALELSSIQWKRKNALFSLLCNHNKLGYLVYTF